MITIARKKNLDSGYGHCWLKNPNIASLVNNALRYFDGSRYFLHAWTIMPNHVHVLFTLSESSSVSSILFSWKSFTAKQAINYLEFRDDFGNRNILIDKSKVRDNSNTHYGTS